MIDKRYLFVVETVEVMCGETLKSTEPDRDGYYDTPLMVLGAETIAGTTYNVDPVMRCITDSSNRFNIMLSDGKLFGEFDHPPIKGREDIPRLLEIYQKETSHHIKRVWTHPTPLSNGGVLLMGKVAPYGPYGKYLDDSFRNPNINTAFSVRSLCSESRHPVTGKLIRDITVLVTFDCVSAGGFREASKRSIPSNESLLVTPNDFNGSVKDLSTALESNTITDSEFVKLFGAKTIRMTSQSTDISGLYRPGSTSFIDNNGNKRSLAHQLIKGV